MSRAAVIFGERIITQSSEYGVHSAGTGTSGNGWIGIGTATGAHAPRHRAIPIAVARGFTRAIVSSGAFPGNLPDRALRGRSLWEVLCGRLLRQIVGGLQRGYPVGHA